MPPKNDKANTFDVFLSHNSADKKEVEAIAHLLKKRKISPFLDKWHLVPGEPWQEALEEALDNSATCAVFLGPNGLSPWENEEMRDALDERVRNKSYRVIPVLLPGADLSRKETLPRFLKRLTWVDFRSGIDDTEALNRLIAGVRGRSQNLRPTRTTDTQAARKPLFAHHYPISDPFVGRNQERETLSNWLVSGDEKVFVLDGMGGQGKSALAWVWVRDDVIAKQQSPSGVFWWSFYEREATFDRFIHSALRYIDQETPATDISKSLFERVDNLIGLFQQHRILLILDGFERELRAYCRADAATLPEIKSKTDNLRNCTELAASRFLRSICSSESKAKVLVTTRLFPKDLEGHDQLPISGCHHYKLSNLDTPAVVSLYKALGIRGSEAEIQAICEVYGYHPLTIRLLAGMILRDPQYPKDIRAAQYYDPVPEAIAREHHILETAYNALSESLKHFLSRIAAFRFPVGYEALKVTGDNPSQIELRNAIKELIVRELVMFDAEKTTYDLHPVVRHYAYDQLVGKVEVHQKLADYFLYEKEYDESENLDQVLELFFQLVSAEELEEALELYLERLVEPFMKQGNYRELLAHLVVFLADDGMACRLEYKQMHFIVYDLIAGAALALGQPRFALQLREAQLQLLDAMRQKEKDDPFFDAREFEISEAMVNLQIATAELTVGEIKRSDARLKRVMNALDTLDMFPLKILADNLCIGLLLLEGEKEQAQAKARAFKSYFLDQVSKDEELKNEALVAIDLEFAKDDPQTALEFADRFKRYSEKLIEGTREQEAFLCNSEMMLATAYTLLMKADAGNYKKHAAAADNSVSTALRRAKRIGVVELEMRAMLLIANLRLDSGKPDESKEYAQEILALAERTESYANMIMAHIALAKAFKGLNNSSLAFEHAQRAKRMAFLDGPPNYALLLEEAEALLNN